MKNFLTLYIERHPDRGGSGQCFKDREASQGYPRSRGPSLATVMGAAAAVSTAAPYLTTSPVPPPMLPWLGGTAAPWFHSCVLGLSVWRSLCSTTAV